MDVVALGELLIDFTENGISSPVSYTHLKERYVPDRFLEMLEFGYMPVQNREHWH